MNLADPIKVLIVDDHFGTREEVANLLLQQPGFILIGSCGTVSQAISLIKSTNPDLLLLDINLPDGTGFDILEKISTQSKVIFLTAYHEFAIRAIRCGALDYLLKPIDEDEFNEALQKMISAQPLLEGQIAVTLQTFRKNQAQEKIALQSPRYVKIVEIKDIMYLHGENGCTTVFLHGGTKIVTTQSIKGYEELLSGTSIIRTHQSYLVNKFYIDRYHRKEGVLYLNDSTLIPVSNRKKGAVEQYIKTL